jgi:hypothetical protein
MITKGVQPLIHQTTRTRTFLTISMGPLTAGLMCAALLLHAQTLTPSQQQDLDNYRLYSAFFSRIKGIDILAAKAESKGKDPQRVTSKMVQTEAQLTDAEFAVVRSAALDSNAQVDANLKAQQQLIQQFKSENPGATKFSPAVGSQLAGIQRQNLQIVLDHIQQIKTGLGDVHFQRFDQYVHTSMGPHLGSKMPTKK